MYIALNLHWFDKLINFVFIEDLPKILIRLSKVYACERMDLCILKFHMWFYYVSFTFIVFIYKILIRFHMSLNYEEKNKYKIIRLWIKKFKTYT